MAFGINNLHYDYYIIFLPTLKEPHSKNIKIIIKKKQGMGVLIAFLRPIPCFSQFCISQISLLF